MSVFSLVYLLLALFLAIVVLKNRIDMVSIGAICFIVYSMYCLPGIGISGMYRPLLSSQLYLLIYIQLTIIIIYVIVNRQKELKGKIIYSANYSQKRSRQDISKDRVLQSTFVIYSWLMLSFTLINVFSIGLSGFAAGKEYVWEQANILYIISLYGVFPSFAYGIHVKNKWVYIPSLIVAFIIFYSGSRAFLATLIVIFLLEKGSEYWTRRGNRKILIIGAVAIVFLLVYRNVDQQIMQGDFEGAFKALLEPETWLKGLEFNEPRVIIANYDYVLTSGVRLPFSDILYRFLDIIPGLTSFLGIKLKYPEYFSTWLMNQVKASAGVGGTFWGESYAMFGIAGVILFTLVWLNFLKFCNKHLNHHKKYSSFIISLGAYLGWYINRLDFNRVFQSIKVIFLCFLIWVIIYLVLGGAIEVGRRRVRIKIAKKQTG